MDRWQKQRKIPNRRISVTNQQQCKCCNKIYKINSNIKHSKYKGKHGKLKMVPSDGRVKPKTFGRE
jgi:hypothetical protein